MKKGFLSGAGDKKKKKKEKPPTPASENQCPPSAPSGEFPHPQEASAAPSAAAASNATATEGSGRSNPVFISQRLTRLIEESSSRRLRLRDAGREGRGVELCKDASPGDVLIQAECFGTVVAEEFLAELCSRCMSPGTKARCVGCGSGFCSNDCLQEAGAEHAAECYALSKLRTSTLSAMTDDESARLALRCLARRAVEAPPADDLHYRDVEDLMTHRHAIVKDGKFASLLRDAKELLALLPPPCADAGAEGIAELLLRVKFNAHPIRDSRQRRIGTGLYPAACLANHSCTPNASISFTPGGGELVLRAIEPVRAGQAVSYAYVDPMQPRSARRAALRDAYFFWCECRRCSEESQVDRGDGAMEAFVCRRGGGGGGGGGGGCHGLVHGGSSESSDCETCGWKHMPSDLANCSAAFEESLRAATSHRDATLRAAALRACMSSPEADRLAYTHHLKHQANMALALSLRELGETRARAECLRLALGSYLSWKPPPSPQFASLRITLGVALAQVGDDGGIDEVEKGMEMQEACFGKESSIVAASAKVLGKLKPSLPK